jgi:hypothetical protein
LGVEGETSEVREEEGEGKGNVEQKNDNETESNRRLTYRIRAEYRAWNEALQRDSAITLLHRPATSTTPSAVIPAETISTEQGSGRCTLLTSLEEATRTKTMRLLVEGSPESPYADGKFEVVLWFCPDYPFKPFSIQMVTPIYHPLICFPEFIQLPTLLPEAKPGAEGAMEDTNFSE